MYGTIVYFSLPNYRYHNLLSGLCRGGGVKKIHQTMLVRRMSVIRYLISHNKLQFLGALTSMMHNEGSNCIH